MELVKLGKITLHRSEYFYQPQANDLKGHEELIDRYETEYSKLHGQNGYWRETTLKRQTYPYTEVRETTRDSDGAYIRKDENESQITIFSTRHEDDQLIQTTWKQDKRQGLETELG